MENSAAAADCPMVEEGQQNGGDTTTAMHPPSPAAASVPAIPGGGDDKNIIRPYGYTESDCGYCKGGRCHLVHKPPAQGSKSYSLLADSMTPDVYEGFMYRGWRRSGIHLYKPCNFESCCPTLSIRLPTSEFRPTKSQKKLLRRINHLIVGESEGEAKNNKAQKNKSSTTDDGMQQVVQQSGILQALEEITDRAVLQVLPDNILATLQQNTQQQNREWKSHFRIRAPSKKERKCRQISATCDICTRISGVVKTVARDELVSKVVDAIRQDAQFVSVMSSGSVSVQEMAAHSSSGQIRCILQLQDQVMSTEATPQDHDSANNNQATNQPLNGDKLAQWYQKTTGRPLDPRHRRITVETMPSHQSALKPEVHKLYAYYQNVVHNDPNPFMGERKVGAPGGNRPANGDNVLHGTSNGDANAHSTSNGDANAHNASTATTSHPTTNTKPTDPSQLDWGNAPMYFKEHIRLMLVNYLAPVPEKHRNCVLENFYSFYQFLVEAPFPFAPQQTHVHSPQVLTVIPKDESDYSAMANRVTPGLYHQHYRLGDLLIAVGVVDILPNGLSSVYLFTIPRFHTSWWRWESMRFSKRLSTREMF